MGSICEMQILLEKMAEIHHLVFDKTGTLTVNGANEVKYYGTPLNDHEKLATKLLCNQSIHPLSRSIYEHYKNDQAEPIVVRNLIEREGKGILGEIGNNTFALGSYQFMNESGFVDLLEKESNELKATRVYLGIDEKIKGHFNIQNKYRKGLNELLINLSSNYHLSLLSGDNIAEKERLRGIFPAFRFMNFNQSPADKLNFIKDLKAHSEKVLMLGDGLNDAGALKESNVGIALTDHVGAFSPSSDAILNADAFDKFPDFMHFSRLSKKMVWASFVLSFAYNFIGIGFAITGNLTPIFAAILMPLSSISVVVFTTFGIRFLAKIKNLG